MSHTKQDRKSRGLKIPHRQPGNTAQKLKPEQTRNTPPKRINPNLPRRYYIFEKEGQLLYSA